MKSELVSCVSRELADTCPCRAEDLVQGKVYRISERDFVAVQGDPSSNYKRVTFWNIENIWGMERFIISGEFEPESGWQLIST